MHAYLAHYALSAEMNIVSKNMTLEVKTNIISVAYPKFAGGKTIVNALGISNNCYLQDYNLVQRQNQGILTSEKKVDLLINRLKSETYQWRDLKLGDSQLYYSNYASDRFKQLQHTKNYFFIVNHDVEDFKQLTKVVSDVICISLVNTNQFINFRLGLDDLNVNRSQYPNLPQQWPTQVEEYFKEKADIVWDCNWFFQKENFLSNLKNMYKTLGLIDFNECLVSKYYDEYITTLNRIILEIKNL